MTTSWGLYTDYTIILNHPYFMTPEVSMLTIRIGNLGWLKKEVYTSNTQLHGRYYHLFPPKKVNVNVVVLRTTITVVHKKHRP